MYNFKIAQSEVKDVAVSPVDIVGKYDLYNVVVKITPIL